MAKVLIGLIAGFVVIVSLVASARNQSLVEILFPFMSDKVETAPADNDLQAPFIEKGGVDTSNSKLIGVEYKPHTALESGVSLDKAHRQPAQILQWSSQVISESFDFDPLRYEAHLQSLNVAMTPFAIEAFKAFMVKDNLLQALNSNNLVMRTFVTDTSRLLNQGPVQGRYRWLIETPVTISFLPRGTTDYETIKPKSQQINVRMQLGRVAEGGVDGVMIETLEFIPVAVKK